DHVHGLVLRFAFAAHWMLLRGLKIAAACYGNGSWFDCARMTATLGIVTRIPAEFNSSLGPGRRIPDAGAEKGGNQPAGSPGTVWIADTRTNRVLAEDIGSGRFRCRLSACRLGRQLQVHVSREGVKRSSRCGHTVVASSASRFSGGVRTGPTSYTFKSLIQVP
ncbi:MAG TPA: hypothetical protein VIT23_15745, partial [Terrimicrobiaceae bacterium]